NNKRENYMSLLELEKSVQFDETKRPACLNTVKEIVEPVFVSGWGISAENRGIKSKTLLKTVLEISKVNEKPLNVDPDSPMLILTKPKPGKKDACMGDSGAPVMTNLKSHP
ncbi:trypsin-like serine protease, partial [bacterium LRH843]|nr:trypsin-like serine protease [bacterium LRH843]